LAEPAVRELIESDPNVEVLWRAFELRPEPVPMIDPNSEYLRRVWSDSVAPQAERLGVTMRYPPVKPRTRLAHQAAHWARAQGRFNDYHNEIFRAVFERGEDIGDADVLIAIAVRLNLASQSLRQALFNHEFAASVLADESEAARLGVNAVPAFVADRKAALTGVQLVENLKRLVERVRDSKHESIVPVQNRER
jgi:predicted DsbA family dithiol-disulfide isomerase